MSTLGGSGSGTDRVRCLAWGLIGVRPAHRRRGLARALVGAALNVLAGRGEAVAIAEVDETNTASRHSWRASMPFGPGWSGYSPAPEPARRIALQPLPPAHSANLSRI